MTHTITWDHGECEHAYDDCLPAAQFTCDDQGCLHRLLCAVPYELLDACEDGWSFCRGQCLEDLHPHGDPGRLHCLSGHPLVLGSECNAVDFLQMGNNHALAVTTYVDGPIEVEFTGDDYLWSYVSVAR